MVGLPEQPLRGDGALSPSSLEGTEQPGFMCLTDFLHDIEGHDGATVYPSERALRKHRTCADECGVAEVRVVLARVVQQPDFSAIRGDGVGNCTTSTKAQLRDEPLNPPKSNTPSPAGGR